MKNGKPDGLSGKERIRLALSFQEADRVPIWELGFHNAVARRIMNRDILLPTGGGRTIRAVLEANASGPSARRAVISRIVDDTMTFYDHMGFDMVRVRPTDFLTPFAFGSGNWAPNALLEVSYQQPNPDTWIIKHPDGFWSRHIYIDESEILADADDSIKQGGIDELRRYIEVLEDRPIDLSTEPLRDALDGIRQAVEHPLAENIFVLGWGDVCYPGSTAHVTDFLMAMVCEPALVHRYMEVTTEGIVQLVRAQADLGVDGITGGNDWAFKAGPIFSVRHLRELIAPYLRRIVDETHRCGLKYIKHGDGDLRSHLPVLVDDVGIDGLHSLEPGANMDIFAFKRQYGDRLALLGNLDCDLLVRGTPDQIEAQVVKLMKAVAPGGGYVFSTSNSVLMDVPPKNLDTMLAAARRFGKYPIRC
ncbi:MAG: uroporphyrinogen decarboxylase family protein [Chloroflexota bacterium]|nr:uroporphyrinogen decarboxylase family protein [Chloroflexota bacterium]